MNFLGYMKKYGSRSFKSFEFNELDGLVFSAFSYIRFEREFDKLEVPIKDVVIKFSSFNKKERLKHYMFENDEKLIKTLSLSKRFLNLTIIDNMQYFDKKTTTQFFAYAVRLTNNRIVVAYRGTDETLLGWQEALNLGIKDFVYGQTKSKQYLEYLIDKYPNDKFYVVGHSKGGNSAIYASSALDKIRQKKILKIYNYDGPSLLNKIKKKSNFDNIKKKITTYLPKGSVVGVSLGNEEKCMIVESDHISVAQHVYYFWRVENSHFKYAKRRSLYSMAFEKSFSKWLSNMSVEQMLLYTGIVFKWLETAKIKIVDDFIDFKKLTVLFKIMGGEKSKEKKAFSKKLREFFRLYIKALYTGKC